MQGFMRSNTQSLALPYGVIRQPTMASQKCTLLVINGTRPRNGNQPALYRGGGACPHCVCTTSYINPHHLSLLRSRVTINKPTIVILCHKTNLLALGLRSHG